MCNFVVQQPNVTYVHKSVVKKKKGVFLGSKQSSEEILSSCTEISVNHNHVWAFLQ